jgi:hypothetical protein
LFLPNPSPDLTDKVEAVLLSKMSEIADQIRDGVLVIRAAVLLKYRDGVVAWSCPFLDYELIFAKIDATRDWMNLAGRTARTPAAKSTYRKLRQIVRVLTAGYGPRPTKAMLSSLVMTITITGPVCSRWAQ